MLTHLGPARTGIGEVTGDRVVGHVSELEELDTRYCVRAVVTIGGIVIYHLVATGVGSRYRVVSIVSVEYGVVIAATTGVVSLPALPSITFAALFPVNWSAPSLPIMFSAERTRPEVVIPLKIGLRDKIALTIGIALGAQ